MAVDLKTLTPDTTLPQDGLLFGADSQASASPSVYPVANVKDALNSGLATLTSGPAISWDCAASPVATVTLTQNATLYASNFRAGGTYKLIVFQDVTGGRTLAYDPNFKWPNDVIPTVSAGANAMTVIEFVSNGTYLYGQVTQAYDGSPAPTLMGLFAAPTTDFTTLSTMTAMPTGGSVSRTGQAMYYDSTGLLTYAPNNLVLNSATPSTQTVAGGVIAGANYILSFKGTGSVAISGGYTGTLAGTGASNRVSLKFSSTTASLTLTVTGSVTEAQLEAVTYQTTPRDYIATTSAAYFGPRFDTDPATLQPKGLLIEGARDNLLTYSEDFSNAAWVKGDLNAFGAGSVANTVISPDGTQTADYIQCNTATQPHRVVRGSQTLSSGTLSCFFKAAQYAHAFIGAGDATNGGGAIFNLSGSGSVTNTNKVGTFAIIAATVVSVGNGWYRCSLAFSGATNAGAEAIALGMNSSGTGTWTSPLQPTFVGDGTSGIYIWGAQLEASAAWASSYVPTVANPGNRLADTFTISGYANRLVEAYWIDQQTGVNNSFPETVVSSGAVTINPPTFGWVTSLRAYTNAYAGDITTPSWIDNSGTTGNRMYVDSTGTLTWAPHNLLLNSATLSTQTVTVTVGATNILSFYGTGSVTLSGGATGTLTGTGATNRVSLVITPTTTSLTLTVSGSVTQAQLERVTYQAQPRAYIPTTSAAVFLPRYDYSPATTPATPLGMLIEESRGNLLTYSDQFNNAAWTLNRVLAFGSGSVANATTAPDGTMTADKIVEDTTATNSHTVRQTPTLTAAAHAFSVYAKAGERSWIRLVNASGTNQAAYFNLATGAVGTVSANATASIVPAGNGWYRCTIVFTVAAAGANALDIRMANADNGDFYTGDGASGIYIWGAQVEAGAFATSYIPTTTAAVTRVGDVVKLTGTALTTLTQPAVSAIGEVVVNGRVTGTSNFILSVSDGTVNNRFYSVIGATGVANSAVSTGNVTQANMTTANTVNVGETARVAIAIAANNAAAVMNGGTVVPDTSLTMPVVNTAGLGYQNYASNFFLNGTVRSLALYNSRLPDATLQKKSAVGAAY